MKSIATEAAVNTGQTKEVSSRNRNASSTHKPHKMVEYPDNRILLLHEHIDLHDG
jgi:hypothetical protein